MICLTFTNEDESFTIFTTRASEATILIKVHSPNSMWPHEWPVYTHFMPGNLPLYTILDKWH